MSGFDVIVVGVGAMGSAACYQLAKRGARVLGLEQFDIPNALGSSHGQSRMIRMAYYEHPDYVPLLRRAYELWEEQEVESGQKLLYLTGGIYIGPPEGEIVAGSLRSAQQYNLPHEFLDRKELRHRFGQFHVDESWVALYEPQAGFLVPERVISAYAQAALREGAEIHGHEQVISWKSDGRGVSVTTNIGEYRADKLVFCGGPWSSCLIRDLGMELVVTRQVLAWVWPRQPKQFALGEFPVFAVDCLDGTLHYGFPMSEDYPGFKVAHHAPGAVTDPDFVTRGQKPGDQQTFRPFLQKILPDANGPLLSMKICLYTNSPDHHFIIDRHPKYERVTIACGFSGHGFKFSSVVGEIIADLALKGQTALPAQFLQLRRFALSSPALSGRRE